MDLLVLNARYDLSGGIHDAQAVEQRSAALRSA